MKKKGFTLVELLVVIAIIAMLLAILMPALNKVRQIAYRVVCGSNCSGLGKACLVYANDYQEAYPVLSGSTSPALQWGIPNNAEFWCNDTAATPFDWTTVKSATVTSSMYLLVKYADVSTGSFVCKATSAKKFDLSTTSGAQNYPTVTTIKDVTQCWDFGKSVAGGAGSWDFCSYAYQMPYTPTTANMIQNALTASSGAGHAVIADASPWYVKGQFKANDTTAVTGPYMPTSAQWGCTGTSPSKDKQRLANSANHNQDGQNVLYADGHSSFETTSNVGVTQDNIYTYWRSATSNAATDQVEVQGGTNPTVAPGPAVGSYSVDDSFLVN